MAGSLPPISSAWRSPIRLRWSTEGFDKFMDSQKSVLVVSAHAADFVWRAGGAIALYAQKGYRVRILCLSYGERGESERLWRQPGMTLDCVKTSRHAES